MRTFTSFSLFCFLVFTSLTVSAAEIQPVKYVFLFIGDGMATPQRLMADEYVRLTESRGLKINRMPHQTATTTHAAGNQIVTDSAAAGTAMACGVKTKNGVLGLDAKGNRVESVAELARKNGRKVGIITSTNINHATPAAFYAHVSSRGSNYDIGLDLVASGFDYFGGGGITGNNDKAAEKYRGNIYDLAKEAGYTICRTPETIKALKPGVGKVLAFGSNADLPYAIDGNMDGTNMDGNKEDSNKERGRLADFTKQAVELLDNPNGFFIMVEGGKIDWSCHMNDAATVIREIIEFDDAVSVAFNFAETKPNEVLIIVTGDHETGGLSLAHKAFRHEILLLQKVSKGTLISLTDKFVKEHKEEAAEAAFETFLPFIMEKSGYGVAPSLLTEADVKELADDFVVSQEAILKNQGSKDKVVNTLLRLFNSKSGVTWSGGGHTALPVLTSVWGSQAEAFARNVQDNTDIGNLLMQAVGR